jgi:hypothetical protein
MKMIQVKEKSEGFYYIMKPLPEVEVNDNYIRMKEVKITAKI